MEPQTKAMPETASQTAGPYVHIGLAPTAAGFGIYDTEIGKDIAGPMAGGERIRVEGVVRDGNGEPVRDVLIEVWQPNADGKFAHTDKVEQGFRGWGRVISDFDTGEWGFATIRPGAVGQGAPHLCLWVVARGINIGLHTRVYFDDLVEANATDPVLNMIDPPAHRQTLIARRTEQGSQPVYRFDIRLQGDSETVFFDI